MNPKVPTGRDWARLSAQPNGALWQSGQVRVLSSLDEAKLPQREDTGPQWHVSISLGGKKRAKAHHVRRALRAFDMVGAELDNHEPGIAQHFWMPVDPAMRVPCECATDETTVIEIDGHRWSNTVDGPCRGCEYVASMARAGAVRSCPLHPEARLCTCQTYAGALCPQHPRAA